MPQYVVSMAVGFRPVAADRPPCLSNRLVSQHAQRHRTIDQGIGMLGEESATPAHMLGICCQRPLHRARRGTWLERQNSDTQSSGPRGRFHASTEPDQESRRCKDWNAAHCASPSRYWQPPRSALTSMPAPWRQGWATTPCSRGRAASEGTHVGGRVSSWRSVRADLSAAHPRRVPNRTQGVLNRTLGCLVAPTLATK